jgi:hydroxyethylthiazole kinase
MYLSSFRAEVSLATILQKHIAMKEILWKHILRVREQSPLVQNITNYVVMNNTANALLAAGASPIMAHAHAEVRQMIAICGSLVVNIGTLDEYWSESMLSATTEANNLGKPWILDPVGAGATPYRNEILEQLINIRPAIIRGNASEILALAKHNQSHTKGVDSTAQSTEAIEAGKFLNSQFGAVVCISGATDIIIDGNTQIRLSNGHEMMTRVTGLGCSATAIIGAFAAVTDNYAEATAAAMSLFGIAGELAAKEVKGPGSLQVALLDKLYSLTEAEFNTSLRIETL